MVGIYLSGTGNTKHCIEKLLSFIDKDAKTVAMEDREAVKCVKSNSRIVIAYPTQFSNAPVMVRDFIKNNAEIWNGKEVFCLVTMGMFSGDGAGCSARILRKYGAKVIGGLHVRMPDSVLDNKLLKNSTIQNGQIVAKADSKIEAVSQEILKGKYPHNGLGLFPHIVGLLGQRLWFYGKTRNYTDKLKISSECNGCGICSKNCPMENITITDGKAVASDKCTMCYRCIKNCPKKAITLLGDKVVVSD